MFGTFGNTNTQPQQGQNPANTGGSIFGNPAQNTTQPSTSGTSLFGNPSQPAQTSGPSLLGNTNTTQTGGGLFGNTNTNQNQTGGVFGNTANQQQQQPGTGLFNTQQQPAGGLFGSTTQSQPTGSVFGNTTNTQQQQQPAGGLFGNTTQSQPTTTLFGNTNAQQPATGGLFGNTASNQQQTGGGLFGNTNTQQQTGGGIFGNASTQPQQTGGLFTTTQQPATGGGLFGGPTQQPATGGLFGSTTTQPATSGGLFGSTTQAPATGGQFGNAAQSTTSTNPLFGNKNPSTLFGGQSSTTNVNQQPSLFGQSTATQPSTFINPPTQQRPAGSLFGSTLTNAPGLGHSLMSSSLLSSTRPNQAQQPADAQSQFTALTQRIEGIARAWDPSSPDCRFQYYFYNLVEPSQVNLYGRPPNATNEVLWQKAVRENPDRTCLVPALAVGFDDLRVRAEAQTQQASEQQEKLKELKKRLNTLTQLHTDINASRLQRAIGNQSQLTHRLLRLVQHLHLLIPALRSSSLRPEEEALRVALEEIEEDIRRPGGISRMRGKLNELWALVGAVNAARERGRKAGDGTEWAVVDEDGLKQITQILAEQQNGIQHLTKVLQRNMKDLAVIQGGGNQVEDTDHSMSLRAMVY